MQNNLHLGQAPLILERVLLFVALFLYVSFLLLRFRKHTILIYYFATLQQKIFFNRL